MIAIKHYAETKVNLKDVVWRSPVAEVPNALELLHRKIQGTEFVFVGFIKDKVACLYGLQPPTVLSNRAHIWLITTNTVDQNKFIFVRHSQLVIEEALRRWDGVYGETHVSDKGAFRWLKWLGAVYGHPYGAFVPFNISKPSFENRRWQTQ